MRTEDFDFELDPSLIAQTPIKNRSDSKLLILDKKNGTIIHESFKNISQRPASSGKASSSSQSI